MSSTLAVWMNGERVATWTVDRAQHRLTYARTWLDSPRRRSLSLSLPITANLEIRGSVVANYFDNLLPDSDQIRERIARRFRTKSAETFDLLQAIGRDCVGAVQLLPEGAEPQGWDRIAGEPLDEHQVAEVLRATPSDTVLGYADDNAFRISLAGAQEKTALLWTQNAWHKPQGATPTTHILKLPLGLAGGNRRVDLGDSVENEWLCAQILYYLHLPVAVTEMWRFEDQKALVVRRFDRSWQEGPNGQSWIARLPQEDFCQALGIPPNKKYEKPGGPGIAACMQLLEGSSDDGDRQTFALTQLAFWLMAATDGHGKNHSLFLQRGDAYLTTPLYDVLSFFPYTGSAPNKVHWRKLGPAMAIRSKSPHWHFFEITPRHWHGLAMRYGGPTVWEAMVRLVDRVEPALQEIEKSLPRDFPPRTWEAIAKGMRGQVRLFQAGRH